MEQYFTPQNFAIAAVITFFICLICCYINALEKDTNKGSIEFFDIFTSAVIAFLWPIVGFGFILFLLDLGFKSVARFIVARTKTSDK